MNPDVSSVTSSRMTLVRASLSRRVSSDAVSTGCDRLKQLNRLSAFLTVFDDSAT
jgi:hypothetical protein